MSYKQDLHIHSWFSDGTMSPAQIIEKYAKEEYAVISITDHERCDAIMEAELLAKEKNMRVITGIELATVMDGLELHILGYYFDRENKELKKELRRLAKAREARNEIILEKLQAMGVEIDEDDLIKVPGQTYVGKPHFARALVEKGYVPTIADAFKPGQYLGTDEIQALDTERMATQDAIDLIKAAGGMAVLAHPCKIKGIGERKSDEFKKNFEELIKKLKKMGLKGLECIYPDHDVEDQWYFVGVAGKYHLHVTEGTDFHGYK